MLGISCSVIQESIIVGYTVTREIKEQKVVSVAIQKERLDLFLNLLPRLVNQGGDIERPDQWVPKHVGQRFGVLTWSNERRQVRIFVLGIRDDKSALFLSHPISLLTCAA